MYWGYDTHMSTRIFRTVSLDRLSSPEQLDALMTITSTKEWLALIAAGTLVIAAIIWGFFGSVSTKVHGYGILTKTGGLQSIIATTTGQVTDIRVMPGDLVHKGMVVARVAQPELVAQIEYAKSQLSALRNSRTTDTLQIAAAEAQLRELQRMLETNSWVICPYDGVIVDVAVKQGDILRSGMSVARLERSGEQIKDLEAILYVSATQSKSVQPGMLVNLSPTSANSQEYGLLLGRVTSVSNYPATYESMVIHLGSEALAQQVARSGAMVQVSVDLIPDVNTPSGYKWTSQQGLPMKLASGTITSGAIVIRTDRPISMVIPIH
jgi:multidrug efflux pump subunit AcrA (membrane-fusion protein)